MPQGNYVKHENVFFFVLFLFGLGMVACVDMNMWTRHKQLFSACM